MNTEIKNAVITGATLTIVDRGFLDACLTLDYGGSGQGFGGYVLYLPPSWKHHKTESVAGHFIYNVLKIADVDEWSKLKGRTIRVRASHKGVEAIAHIIRDEWFYPADDFKSLAELAKEQV